MGANSTTMQNCGAVQAGVRSGVGRGPNSFNDRKALKLIQ